MNPYEVVGYPRLDLCFFEDGQHNFLFDASFWKDGKNPASSKLIEELPKGKYLRSLCILILLAKYKGENPEKPFESIVFGETSEKPSWLNTLGTSFGAGPQKDFFEKYFEKRAFMSASRGSAHNSEDGGSLSSARFYTSVIRLKNVNVFRVPRLGKKDVWTPIKPNELPAMALRLEKYEIGRGSGWSARVKEMVATIDRKRPLKLSDRPILAGQSDQREGLLLKISDSYYDFANVVRAEIQNKAVVGTWYVICADPIDVCRWREIFHYAAMRDGSVLKFAYWSPRASKDYDSMKKWRKSRKYINGAEDEDLDLNFDQAHLLDDRVKMLALLKKLPEGLDALEYKKGSFEFYESYMRLDTIVVFFVPLQTGKNSRKIQIVAPEGSWGFLNFHPLGIKRGEIKGEDKAIYLNQPSPILDLCFREVIKFFKHGLTSGYLKFVKAAQPAFGRKRHR